MISPYETIARLLLGALLGGIIGFERQAHGRPAGFRTQLLVCVASVLLMIISENYSALTATDPDMYMRFDPTRIAAGTMTGVGFLGAGVILKTGVSIQGLTTAACIWIVSAIGLAVGAGQYIAAISGFVIAFLSLWVLRIFEPKIPSQRYTYITLTADVASDEKAVRSLFESKGFRITKMDYDIDFPGQEKSYIFTIVSSKDGLLNEVVREISGLGFVKRLQIKS